MAHPLLIVAASTIGFAAFMAYMADLSKKLLRRQCERLGKKRDGLRAGADQVSLHYRDICGTRRMLRRRSDALVDAIADASAALERLGGDAEPLDGGPDVAAEMGDPAEEGEPQGDAGAGEAVSAPAEGEEPLEVEGAEPGEESRTIKTYLSQHRNPDESREIGIHRPDFGIPPDEEARRKGGGASR